MSLSRNGWRGSGSLRRKGSDARLAGDSANRPRSGGAFFMPGGLTHAAKSFCVNDLLGNIE
jgi:hypothetical protein